MALLVQLLLAVFVGAAAWFISNLVGIADPWPVIIGMVAALLCLGVAVIIVDEDMF